MELVRSSWEGIRGITIYLVADPGIAFEEKYGSLWHNKCVHIYTESVQLASGNVKRR